MRCQGFLKRSAVLLNRCISLFWTKEVIGLAIIMGGVYVWGVIYGIATTSPGCSLAKWTTIFLDSFFDLFDVDAARSSVWKVIPFLVTWLVGGGALVGVVVGQYNKNAKGELRLWPCLVRDHVVVLGWDDGVLAELVDVLSSSKYDCFVVTSRNAIDVKKVMETARIDKSRIHVYHGNYDDEKEWRDHLKIERAERIFIMGESGEDAHDARVRILYDKMKVFLEKTKNVAIKVNVHDFGLAQKLEPNAGVPSDGSGIYENFHLRWAAKLWSEWDLDFDEGIVELYITGFGAMGKAVAIKAIEQKKIVSSIFVADDDEKKLKEEQSRFLRQFKDDKYKKVEFIPEWNDALAQIKKAAEDKNKKVIIVVAKKRSEKGMLCMMDIISQLSGCPLDNVKFALDQEVDGYSVDSGGKDLSEVSVEGLKSKVSLFGMKRGCKW